MKNKSFGKTGIIASEYIFGTWYLPNGVENGQKKVSKEESIKLIQKAYDLGINFFDTADVYRGVYNREQKVPSYDTVGMAEKILGEALEGYDRDSYVVATKVTGRTGPYPSDSGANRKHVFSALNKSLQRLGMDYADFYLVHVPDPNTGIKETARTMNLLQEQGKILHYGLSNFPSHSLMDFLRLEPYESPQFIQDKFNLIEREMENSNLRVAEENSLASMIYSPLAQGVLAGRYLKNSTADTRAKYETLYSGISLHEKNRKGLEELKELAAAKGVSMSQLSLAWLLHKGKFVFPILGATKIEQIEENLAGGEIKLTGEEIEELESKFHNL